MMRRTSQRGCALITGGSRGIGRAVAVALAKEGSSIATSYLRNDEAARQTAKDIRRLGGSAWLHRMDLRSPDEIRQMFEEIKERYRYINCFVHAAALGVFKSMLELSPLQISRVFDINSRSFIICSQEASRLMKGGSIVAISSLGSRRYISEYGAMGIAKASLEAAVRYLAVELASQGIRVNGVCGGPVSTRGIRNFSYYRKGKAQSEKMTPAGRIATPKDIANVVSFLCRAESDWIRGQILVADGGLSLRVVSL